MGSTARLEKLCRRSLSGRRLILASNRGPVEYYLSDDGVLQARRGSGGVVTTLGSLSQYVELCWIASVMGKWDRQAALRAQGGRLKIAAENEQLYLQFIVSPGNTYHKYYSVICNPLLWFLQHYMWNSPRTPNIDRIAYDAWENGYVVVNQAFARAVIDEVRQSELPPVVMLNDYHLYLASAYIREQVPELIIQHFTHIPWPDAFYWHLLPRLMRQAIHRSLCTADIVGLQTVRDVHNFLDCCQAFVDGAEVDFKHQTVRTNGHITRVKAYPISIDVTAVRQLLSSEKCRQYLPKLANLYGEKTIVRVDRCEPSKNIIRGFRAFDMLLERYPQLRGKIRFIAFLVPTRTHLKPYQRYFQDVIQLVEDINNKYRTADWYPIDYLYKNNYAQAIAGMTMYDVLLVNAVVDGMNLVAKEGPIVNTRDGVLILSESVGACAQLGENALTVTPTDLEETTQTLYAALTMPPDEKKRRAAALKKSIEKEDITDWLLHLLEDIVTLLEERSGTATPENTLHHLYRSK